MTFTSKLWAIVINVDGFLALALVLFLVGSAAVRGHVPVPRVAYLWAFGLGLVFCLGSWGLLLLSVRLVPKQQALGETMAAVRAYTLLAPALLGAESGLSGFFGLPRPWSGLSLAFGVLSFLLAVAVLALIVAVKVR